MGIFRIVIVLIVLALSMALSAIIPASEEVIFKDRFQPVDKPPVPEPPPITQITGRAFKGPFRPGTEIFLTPLNDDLLQLAPSYRGDVINHQGDYRISALIPQGPVAMQAHGHFLNELTNEASPSALRLQAITKAQPEIHVHPLTHLETQRVRTLISNGMAFEAAKAQALDELITILGFASTTSIQSTNTPEDAIPVDSTQIDLDTPGGDALLTLSAILVTTPDGQPRTTEAMQVWLTTLREDLADGQISPDQQSALVQSAIGALSAAQTIKTNLAALLTANTQNPITLPALSPLLIKTLEANAYRVEIGAGTGGGIEPSGTRWLMSNQTQTVSLTPAVGHELIEVASTCGGALDETDPQNTTFTTAELDADCVLNASFELKSYPIAIQVPDGAVLTPALPEAIDHGQVASFVVTPPQGFDGITLTGCGGQLLGQTYTTAPITAPCTLSLAFYQKFFMADNATTVLCPDAQVGDFGTLNGMAYTKRGATEITPDNAATTCTSGITDMGGLFEDELTFNGDIRHWDTQAVTHMDALFKNAQAFDQDLGGWCVEGMITPPTDFDVGADGWVAVNARPNWGMACDLLTEVRTLTVASNTGGSLSDEGSIEILHGRRRAFELSVEADYGLVSVTGCGGTLTGTTYLTGVVTADCNITATFGPFYLADNGLTVVCTAASLEETGLVDGVMYTKRAATDITPANAETTCTTGITNMSGLFANEAGFNADIGHWDTASVTNMMGMFQGAATFNRDLQDWDTRQVTDMNYMFYQAGNFAQDLSGWCVENVTSTPFFFAQGSGLTSGLLPLFGAACGP